MDGWMDGWMDGSTCAGLVRHVCYRCVITTRWLCVTDRQMLNLSDITADYGQMGIGSRVISQRASHHDTLCICEIGVSTFVNNKPLDIFLIFTPC